jgi:predicted nucleic acid-binding protein
VSDAGPRVRPYLDTSALLKLVFDEPERPALRTFIAQAAVPLASVLLRIEAVRACRRLAADAAEVAERLVRGVQLIPIDQQVVDAACVIEDPGLRSLDAIHLATALTISPRPVIVTYDHRLADAAVASGLNVLSPA